MTVSAQSRRITWLTGFTEPHWKSPVSTGSSFATILPPDVGAAIWLSARWSSNRLCVKTLACRAFISARCGSSNGFTKPLMEGSKNAPVLSTTLWSVTSVLSEAASASASGPAN